MKSQRLAKRISFTTPFSPRYKSRLPYEEARKRIKKRGVERVKAY